MHTEARRGTLRNIHLPSLELGSPSGAAPGGSSIFADRHITAEEVGRTGHRHSLMRAIEEGHALGYDGPEAYLAALPESCSPGGLPRISGIHWHDYHPFRYRPQKTPICSHNPPKGDSPLNSHHSRGPYFTPTLSLNADSDPDWIVSLLALTPSEFDRGESNTTKPSSRIDTEFISDSVAHDEFRSDTIQPLTESRERSERLT